MTNELNVLGQPIGFPIGNWTARPRPSRTPIEGHYCRLEPADPEQHAAQLHAANLKDTQGSNWTYMPYGPFANIGEYRAWMEETCLGDDPLFHTIIDQRSDRAVGIASYLRIEPTPGVIEVGHINYSPALQKTPAATEAMYLLMRRVFDELGYRRYEWKCDALNAGSCAAAKRLGFQFEGIFRQATIYKNRNRDTAWFSIIDNEWPKLKNALEQWLAPSNFGANGSQNQRLSDLIKQPEQ